MLEAFHILALEHWLKDHNTPCFHRVLSALYSSSMKEQLK